MGDQDQVFKPSFYAASLTFTIAVLALVVVLAGVMATVPASRPHTSVFLPVIAVGGAAIVVQALRRIRAVEKSYAYTTTYKESSNARLGCPDSFVASGRQCVPKTSLLTLDPSLVPSDKARSSTVVQHVPANTPAMDMVAIRAQDKGAFLSETCRNTAYMELPWATHKALCPVAEI